MAKVGSHLPVEYRKGLVGDAAKQKRDPAAPAVVLGDVLIERVARRAALGPTEARRASEAVMETLAEQLPEDLHPALERGNASTGVKAQRMSLDEFIERIAIGRGSTTRRRSNTPARSSPLCATR